MDVVKTSCARQTFVVGRFVEKLVWLVSSMEKMFPFCVVDRDPKMHQLYEMVGSRKVSGAKGPVGPVNPVDPAAPGKPFAPLKPMGPGSPVSPFRPCVPCTAWPALPVSPFTP